jgi:hypothetical protein
MRVTYKPTCKAICEAYGFRRQWLFELKRTNGLNNADFTNPSLIFDTLLSRPASTLRTRLTDHNLRQQIIQKLKP